jgi:hypothetical protein
MYKLEFLNDTSLLWQFKIISTNLGDFFEQVIWHQN